MEKGEFFNPETKTIHPTLKPDLGVKGLDEIKAAFWQYRNEGTVKEWNLLREEAKEHFTDEEISRLDASGFIREWIKGRAE